MKKMFNDTYHDIWLLGFTRQLFLGSNLLKINYVICIIEQIGASQNCGWPKSPKTGPKSPIKNRPKWELAKITGSHYFAYLIFIWYVCYLSVRHNKWTVFSNIYYMGYIFI